MKQLHEIKCHQNLLHTKIFNYLVIQKPAKFYTLEIFYACGIRLMITAHVTYVCYVPLYRGSSTAKSHKELVTFPYASG